MMIKSIITICCLGWIWLGGGTPSSPLQAQMQSVELSDFVVMDNKPTTRPIVQIMSVRDSITLLATDEGLWFGVHQRDWKMTLHHDIRQLMIQNDTIYAVLNRFHRKAKKMYLRVWMSVDGGLQWKPVITPNLSAMVAIDSKHKLLFTASRHGTRSLRYAALGSDQFVTLLDERFNEDVDDINTNDQGDIFIAAKGRLYVSQDSAISFTDITPRSFLDIIGRIDLLVGQDLIIACKGRQKIAFSLDGSRSWKTLSKLNRPSGIANDYRLQFLSGDKQLVLQQGLFKHHVWNLKTGKVSTYHLPRTYRYLAHGITNGKLLISGTLPEKSYGIASIYSKLAGPAESAKSNPVFIIALSPNPCKQLLLRHKPQIMTKAINAARGWLIDDNDSLYRNTGTEIENVLSRKTIAPSSSLFSSQFTKGSTGKAWYRLRRESFQHRKNYQLINSLNKGKSWQPILNEYRFNDFSTLVHDDSLQATYGYSKNSIYRYDHASSQVIKTEPKTFEGDILNVQIDTDSRVWVTTSKGIYLSLTDDSGEDWWLCPLPFLRSGSDRIQGFAFLDQYLAVGYQNAIYVSRNDTIAFNKLIVAAPCDTVSVPVRLLGTDGTSRLVLQDRTDGHVIVRHLTSGTDTWLPFPKQYGVPIRIDWLRDLLLVQTSGYPFVTLEQIPAYYKGSVLYSYLLPSKP